MLMHAKAVGTGNKRKIRKKEFRMLFVCFSLAAIVWAFSFFFFMLRLRPRDWGITRVSAFTVQWASSYLNHFSVKIRRPLKDFR